jgi:hypothetical protein
MLAVIATRWQYDNPIMRFLPYACCPSFALFKVVIFRVVAHGSTFPADRRDRAARDKSIVEHTEH